MPAVAEVDFEIEGRTVPQLFVIRIGDNGPGIANLQEILEGRYVSRTGMGIGLVGPGGWSINARSTVIPKKEPDRSRKIMPRHAPLVTTASLRSLVDHLSQRRPQGPIEEVNSKIGSWCAL